MDSTLRMDDPSNRTGLHLTVDDAGPAMAGIRAFLDRRGVAGATVTPIVPTMEDVFVALIEKEDRHHGTVE